MLKVTKKKKKKNNVANIFKVNNQETRMASGASIIDFEHILHFILLLTFLNLNILTPFGPEKR